MKNSNLLSVAWLTAAFCCPLGLAQETSPTAPAAAPAVAPVAAEPVIIDHVVYLARLPTPAELMKGAENQGTPIARMDQTAGRIVVVYQYAGGREVTFAYTLLSSAGSTAVAVAPRASSATYAVVPNPAPTPTVVYYTPPDPVYYSSFPRYVRYYDPAWDFWAPFSLGLGVGWIGESDHGDWYGGDHRGDWYGGDHRRDGHDGDHRRGWRH